MNKEQKERLKQQIKTCGLWLAAGILYYLFVRFTGWGLPCLITKITGKLCPGCGITRMAMALIEGDFALAARNNLLVLCLLPFGLFFWLRRTILYIKKGETHSNKWELAVLLVLLVITVAFWILRNLPAYSFLAPV